MGETETKEKPYASIFLTGQPGTGKTAIAKKLAARFGSKAIKIDDLNGGRDALKEAPNKELKKQKTFDLVGLMDISGSMSDTALNKKPISEEGYAALKKMLEVNEGIKQRFSILEFPSGLMPEESIKIVEKMAEKGAITEACLAATKLELYKPENACLNARDIRDLTRRVQGTIDAEAAAAEAAALTASRRRLYVLGKKAPRL